MTIPDLVGYDVILVNTSGGKDSQAMLDEVYNLAVSAGVVDRLVAVHADLGRVEWPGTAELAQQQAERYGLRFIKVTRPQGDLLTHIEQRGMFPSSTTRYCTSDHKRGQIRKVMTMLTDEQQHRARGRRVRILKTAGRRVAPDPRVVARRRVGAHPGDRRAPPPRLRRRDAPPVMLVLRARLEAGAGARCAAPTGARRRVSEAPPTTTSSPSCPVCSHAGRITKGLTP